MRSTELKSLANPRDSAELLRRLPLVRADSPRRWGRMSAHQMICHLRDAFLMGTGDKPVSHLGFRGQSIVKWLALYGPLPWPSGIPTRPEIDQRLGGTRPSEFQADVDALVALVERITSEPEYFRDRRHPIFGSMSEADWLRWGYLHVDHHLRQFGV